MFCAISGEVPKEPVFSPKTGYVYEKALITKALEANKKCPVTGQELSADDVVIIKRSKVVTPRPPSGNSIPSLLETMATEWDSLMLETFELKKQLQTTREELVRTLYERDAACRVIARLIKERDAARAELKKYAGTVYMDMTDEPKSFEQKLKDTASELTNIRRQKKKSLPPDLISKEQISKFALKETVKAHKTTKPGVLCSAVDPKADDYIFTGGADGEIRVNERTKDSSVKTVAALAKHGKAVVDLAVDIGKNVLLSSSTDRTALLWKSSEKLKFEPAFSVTEHKSAVIACDIHATKDYIGTFGEDGSFLISDIQNGSIVLNSKRSGVQTNYAKFHPDGLLVGFAEANGVLAIWDVLQDQLATSMKIPGGHPLNSLCFSENGFTMATIAENVVQLWDLRKQKLFNTLPLEVEAKSCKFDFSGVYFAAGDAAGRISLYSTLSKPWEKVGQLHAQSNAITSISFGENARFLVSTSLDRSMCIFE